ncbi:hypothetical protein F5Y09DRAFT_340411 [Xylaria sp. FL1042]|nr:hypothetical protein F5Y09DRAFT_340411 [Xylaria sp. FL1042]
MSSPASSCTLDTPNSGTPESFNSIESPLEPSPIGTPASSTDGVFARPPSDFDHEKAKRDFLNGHGQGFWNPADEIDESVEDEIERKIAELEKATGSPVSDEQKERIANKIRSLREGGWLEGLKPLLVGKDSVPIEYFNRLAAEHENTIFKVAQINARADIKVAEKEAQIASLEKELNSVKKNLKSACRTLYEDVKLLQQQKAKSQRIEKGLKDQVIKLIEENEHLNDAAVQSKVLEKENKDLKSSILVEGQLNDSKNETLRKRITELEAWWEECQDIVKSLEKENESLTNAAQRDADDSDEFRRQIVALRAEISSRNGTIKTLESQLHNSPPPQQDQVITEVSSAVLQARCVELRDERDKYKSLWAGKVVADNATMVQFWNAVETTSQEVKQLYLGIDRLGHVLGLSSQVLDIPSILDKIIEHVVSPGCDENLTPQLSLLHLRNANAIAQIQIETLKRELAKAQMGKSDDEIRAQLRIVDEEELEKRVTARTQSYREQRRAILSHIADAQEEFLTLADRSADKVAIEALVNQFLQLSRLPMI